MTWIKASYPVIRCLLLGQVEVEAEEPVHQKYQVRPPKNLRSAFLQRMEDRQKAKDLEIQRKIEEEEAQRIAVSAIRSPYVISRTFFRKLTHE